MCIVSLDADAYGMCKKSTCVESGEQRPVCSTTTANATAQYAESLVELRVPVYFCYLFNEYTTRHRLISRLQLVSTFPTISYKLSHAIPYFRFGCDVRANAIAIAVPTALPSLPHLRRRRAAKRLRMRLVCSSCAASLRSASSVPVPVPEPSPALAEEEEEEAEGRQSTGLRACATTRR